MAASPTEPAVPSVAEPVSAPAGPPSRADKVRDVALRLEAIALICAGLASILFYVFTPRALPSTGDYEGLAAALKSQLAPGDAILLDPHWAERLRLFVTGAPILNLDRNPTREDLYRYRRVFLVSLPELPRSHRDAAIALLESFRFRKLEGPKDFGKLSLTVFENAALQTPSFDFTSEVAYAKVYIRRGDGTEELCPLVNGRHPCPRAGWINVGAETKEIAFKPYRCVWAHPAGTERLVVEYANVPLGKELRVMGGIVGQIAFRRESYGVTNLDVKIDGQRIGDIAIPPGMVGEQRRTLDTARLAPGPHQVAFEVWAENPDMRHFCFDAGAY